MKLAPYARELIAARKRGLRINLHVIAGEHAWRRAGKLNPPSVLCLPPEESFESFDWSCVAGLHVTLAVWNRPPQSVDAFARHLVLAGAELVAALGAQHDGERVMRCEPTYYRLAARTRRVA